MKLAEWHFVTGQKQKNKSEKIKHFTDAIQYIGKAQCFPDKSFSQEINLLASRIFRICAVQYSIFSERLERSISNENKMEVLHLVHDLGTRFHAFCCHEEQNCMIKLFYEQISVLYNQTVIARRPGRLENSGLASIYPSMEAWLDVGVHPKCLLTVSYREQLNAFREEFAARYEEVRQDRTKVRDFQSHMSALFIAFLERLMDDAIAIVGDPPCDFDCRLMGSPPKREPCPRSDVEWFILINDEQQLPYFLELARAFDLLITSLGEDAATDLPVFTCVGIKHRSGLHVDKAGNPVFDPDLIRTPQEMAKAQKALNYQPCSIANSSRTTISLKKNTDKLFDDFQNMAEAYLDEIFPNTNETYRAHQAFLLFSERLMQFEKVWSAPFQEPTLHMKEQFTELLNRFLNDMSLYFNIKSNNTFDVIDELEKKEIFTSTSAKLLREAVAHVYILRVGLHVKYEEQKEEIDLEVISEKDRKRLEKIYWLILRPLYRRLKKCLNEPRFFNTCFQSVDLLKWAFFDESFAPQTISQLKPLVEHLAEHLALKSIAKSHKSYIEHRKWHKLYYAHLSSLSQAEALRATYIDTLAQFKEDSAIAHLISFLAKIPNNFGVRQAQRLEKNELKEAILAITTTNPEGDHPVFVRFSGAPEGRYLRQAVIEQIIEQNGDIKHKYQSTAHNVAFATYQDYSLHFKQKPNHPLMEYAIYSLMGRFDAQLAPPVELVRFEVEGKAPYPVLISKTIDGRVLGGNDSLESSSFTWGCLLAILTWPGDGRFSNYLKENGTGRLVLIDGEISFVEPLTREIFGYKVHFTSALFCLHPKPLDRAVLAQFLQLDPALIVKSWMDELIAVDRRHRKLQLFSEKEEERLYNEDPEKRFKGTLILRSGVIITLLVQFHHLQDGLRHVLRDKNKKDIYPLDLLPFLITLRETDIQAINHVYRNYLEASSQPSTRERLYMAVNRSIEASMTSLQADGISFGRIPSMQEILSREQYAPEKAQKELEICEMCNRMPGVTIGRSKGQLYFKANFKEIKKAGEPDLESQHLLVRALIFLMLRTIAKSKPRAVSITYCEVLNAVTLRPFLHKDLECLNLSGCPLIDQEAIELIERQCPNLKRLYLNSCAGIVFFAKTNFLFSETYLHFPKLKVLQVRSCDLLVTIQIDAPLLEMFYADHNPRLTTLMLKPMALYLKGSFKDCARLDLEKIKENELLKWLPKSKFQSNMLDPLMHLYSENPVLNFKNGFVEGEYAKTLSKALASRTCLTELDLENNDIGAHAAAIFTALGNHTKLRSLNLANTNVSPKDLLVLNEVLEKQSSLTSINFANNGHILSKIPGLLNALKSHKLRELNLENCGIAENEVVALSDLLKSQSSLCSINLNDNNIGENAEQLNEALASHTSLTEIRLARNSIRSSATLEALLVRFAFLPHLKIVDFTGNKFGERGLTALMQVFPYLTTLTTLNIDDTNICNTRIEELNKSLPSLTSLTGSGTIIQLSQTLTALPSLRSLDLSGCRIQPSGGRVLSRSLSTCSSLRSINLKGNQLTPLTIRSLCQDLTAHPSLNSINFAENRIGDEGDSVIRLLRSLTSLRSLDLEKTAIDPKDMDSLCQMLKHHSNLTSLNLADNKISSQGAIALSKAIARSRNLTSINLENCDLDDRAISAIIKSLKNHFKLTSLNLAGNRISPKNHGRLCKVIAYAPNLISINLAFTNYWPSEEQAKETSNALVHALGFLPKKLSSIQLDSNGIGPDGMKVLCRALAGNSSLKLISLSGNPLCDRATKFLSKLISRQSGLTDLRLDAIQIGDFGAYKIANALNGKTFLSHFSLKGNYEITKEAAHTIRAALISHTSLPFEELCSFVDFIDNHA